MKKNEKINKAKSPDTAKKRKKAESPREAALETLHQSEERYRTILENMQEGYFEVDLTGNFTFCNDSLCRIHKRSKDEMMRMNNRQYMYKETQKKVFNAFNRVYKTGEPLPEIDWQIIRKDGVIRYIEASVSLLKDSSGKPIGFRGITRDVTERKKAEEKLQENERQYRLLTERMSDIVWTADMNLRTTYISPSVKNVLGFSQEERMRQTLNEQLTPHSVSLVLDVLSKELTLEQQGNADPNRTLKVELEYYHKDGSTRWMDLVVSGLRNDQGVLTGIHGVSRDITERKKAQENLRESEEKYRNLIERATDGIGIAQEGILLYTNERLAQLYGYSVVESIGKPFIDFFAPEEVPKVLDRYKRRMAGEKVPPVYETALKCKDGSRLDVEVNAGIINYEGKKADLVFIRDITERKKAEEALRESEYKYKSLIENIPDIIFTIDLEGKITFVSKRTKEILGYENAETINRNIFNFIPQEDHQRAMESLQKGMKGEKIKHVQMPVTAKSGEKLFFEFSFSRIYKDGAVVGAQGTAVDITERKRTEEKLRTEEQRFRALAEQSSDIIIFVNREGIVTYENPAIEKSLGFKPEKRIGVNLFDRIHPDDLKFATDAFNAFLLDTSSKNINAPIRQIRARHQDGSWRTFETSGSKLIDDNIVETVIINLRDITERKRVEESLRESEERFRSMIQSLSDIIFILDGNGQLTYESPSATRILGYQPGYFIGKSPFTHIHPDDLDQVMKDLDEVFLSVNSGIPTEFRYQKADDTWIYLEALGNNQFENPGIQGIVLTVRDITERKKAEEKLQQTLESLRKAVGTTIQVLVSAVESRDSYTAGHQSRSANLACAIATEMGLSQEKIEGIRMTGIIHDIGKLSIPAEILSKPTKLTEIEFSLIKEHARSGYEMLKEVESPWPLAEIVYQHHERMNGSGYPRNLKGNEILMESRILAVADVVEAMASHRPYRASLGIEAAIEEIEKNKGILYDDAVADACLKLFREKGYQLT